MVPRTLSLWDMIFERRMEESALVPEDQHSNVS